MSTTFNDIEITFSQRFFVSRGNQTNSYKVSTFDENLNVGSNLFEESSIELDNVRTLVGSHHHVQIHQKLLLFLLIHRGSDPLHQANTHIYIDIYHFQLTVLSVYRHAGKHYDVYVLPTHST